jgi:hypothetical protein
MRASLSLAFLPVLLLSGCGDDKGTTISINGKDEAGKPATASMDGDTGRVKVDVPGFAADIKLPKIQLDAGNFDMNGVKLYPGSTITNMSIDSAKGADAVAISFSAPADPAKVKTWFAGKMKAARFTVADATGGLSGKTEDGDGFSLTLTPDANGHSNGTIRIAEK